MWQPITYLPPFNFTTFYDSSTALWQHNMTEGMNLNMPRKDDFGDKSVVLCADLNALQKPPGKVLMCIFDVYYSQGFAECLQCNRDISH